jgi:hypothetical protein
MLSIAPEVMFVAFVHDDAVNHVTCVVTGQSSAGEFPPSSST